MDDGRWETGNGKQESCCVLVIPDLYRPSPIVYGPSSIVGNRRLMSAGWYYDWDGAAFAAAISRARSGSLRAPNMTSLAMGMSAIKLVASTVRSTSSALNEPAPPNCGINAFTTRCTT